MAFAAVGSSGDGVQTASFLFDAFNFVHQCAQGTARSENCRLLTGDTLADSPGELFLIKPEFGSRFVKILADCVRFYLAAKF